MELDHLIENVTYLIQEKDSSETDSTGARTTLVDNIKDYTSQSTNLYVSTLELTEEEPTVFKRKRNANDNFLFIFTKEHFSNLINNQTVNIIPLDKDLINKPVSVRYPDAIHYNGFYFKETFWDGDYSNKILLVRKQDVQIIKKVLDSGDKNGLVYVIDDTTAQQIQKNEYHLDDLQYNIVKSLGTDPANIKITYLVGKQKKYDERYIKINLAKTLETNENFLDQDGAMNVPTKIRNVEVDDKSVVSVAVYNFTNGSTWLGGYRNRQSGVYYHNATCQTPPRKRDYGRPPWNLLPKLFTKSTQTPKPYKEIGINLPTDHSTQMSRDDYFVPSDTDKIMNPRLYKPIELPTIIVEDERQNKAALIIQRNWKYYLKRKKSRFSLEDICEQVMKEYENSQAENIITDFYKQQMLDLVFPYKKEHFQQLHKLVDKYITDKELEVKLMESSASKQAEMCLIFDEKLNLLQDIRKRWLLSNNDMLERRNKQLLEAVAAPALKRSNQQEKIVVLEKYGVEKWKIMKELYNLYRKKDASVNQRIEILMFTRQLLELEDFDMKDIFFELNDRESILLSTGTPQKYLETLRKWSAEILLSFIKKKKREYFPIKPPTYKNLIKCRGCKKFKNSIDFSINFVENEKNYCNACLFRMRASVKRGTNVSHYIRLLFKIREDELKRGCRNPYIFLLQPYDICYIVEKIWGGQPALGSNRRVSELRLPRLDKNQPWAPWNCILLDATYAAHHENLINFTTTYSKSVCDLVRYRQLKGLMEYKELLKVERRYQNFGEERPIYELNMPVKHVMNATNAAGDPFFRAPPTKKHY